MKKIFSITALILAVTVFLPTYICEAKDVWVSHWNSENIDVYVMDDTLRGDTSDTERQTENCLISSTGPFSNTKPICGDMKQVQWMERI